MIARLRCYLFGHVPRLVAYAPETRRRARDTIQVSRVETWVCDRCPWARNLRVAGIGVMGPAPAPAGLVDRVGSAVAFYGLAGLVIVLAIALLLGWRP